MIKAVIQESLSLSLSLSLTHTHTHAHTHTHTHTKCGHTLLHTYSTPWVQEVSEAFRETDPVEHEVCAYDTVLHIKALIPPPQNRLGPMEEAITQCHQSTYFGSICGHMQVT